MASTYSSNLKLELMGTGDQSGTWGDTTNTNIGTLLEQAVVGYTTQAITDGADTVLTIANGATSVARNYVLQLTGTLTANRNLIVPAIQKPYIIHNATTGGFSVTVKVAGQTGVTVANGKRALVYNNGTDIIEFANAPVTEAGTQTLTNKTLTSPTVSGGTINNATIGASTASSGSFTTLSASSTVSGTGFSTYLASPPAIGGTAPAAGSFTTLSASSTVSGTGFTNYFASPPAIGGTTPSSGAFTTISATGDGTFSGTGQVKFPVGTTAQRSGSPATGMFRFNSTLGSFEGYNGTAWGTVGGDVMPSGVILPYAGSTAPSGFLLAFGQAVSRTTYAALFTAIGTTYGTGDGSTTFNLPDLRGRAPRGVDNMGGTAANRITSGGSGITGTTLGAAGGVESVTLTTAQLASHTHTVSIYSGTTGSQAPSVGGGIGVNLISSGSAGSGNAHNNTGPTIMLNYIIKT